MVKIDFSICLRGSAPVVRNFVGVGFDVLAKWLQPGDEWDGEEQPAFRTDKTPPYTHKTYNGYLASTFHPITKDGRSLRAGPSNPAPGYRNSANVARRSLLMLDFDDMPRGTLAQVIAEMRAESVLGAVYTTYSHLNAEKGGLERFRAVVVTDRPMEAGEIGKASYAFFQMIKEWVPAAELDVASFNPAFAMYRPPANSQVTLLDQGEPWETDNLLDDFENSGMELPIKAMTSSDWEPATPADMKLCEDWLHWAQENNLTVSDGQIWVCCPMHERHSTGSKGDGTDGGAAILLPNKRKGQATFKCLHSTCDSDVNRNQRDTMISISEELEATGGTGIPEHLLPDPHGGFGEQDRAAMRRMLARDEPEEEGESVSENGVRKRVRKEGAVDRKDMPNRIGGTYMIDVSPRAVERLAALAESYVFVVQGGRSKYFHRYVDQDTKKARWSEWEMQTIRDVLAGEEGITGGYQKGDEVKFKTVSMFDAFHHWGGRPHKLGGAAIFPPPAVCPSDMLNTWEGFAVDPVEGDISPFKDYVKTVLCSGDKKLAHYFTQWLSHMFQHPGTKPGVAIVMRSGEGNGKGQLAKLLDRIMGDLFAQYNGTEKLTGQFNISLMTTLCAFIDEAKAKGQENATIRGLVTESRALFEGKGSNAIKGTSFTRLMFASNESVLKISKGDRRYCVLTLDPKYAANDNNPDRDKFAIPFWRQFSAWANQSWVPSAVLHYLMGYPLEGFDEFNAPKTKAHRELVGESLSMMEEWVLWQVTENKFRKGTVATRPNELVLLPSVVVARYMEYLQEKGLREIRTPMALKNEFGKLMKRMNTKRTDFGNSVSAENRYGYVFPSQDDLYFDICDALGVNPEYD